MSLSSPLTLSQVKFACECCCLMPHKLIPLRRFNEILLAKDTILDLYVTQPATPQLLPTLGLSTMVKPSRSTHEMQRRWRWQRVRRRFQSSTRCQHFSYNSECCYSTWHVYRSCRHLPGLRQDLLPGNGFNRNICIFTLRRAIHSRYIYRLLKSLYKVPSAARAWYTTRDNERFFWTRRLRNRWYVASGHWRPQHTTCTHRWFYYCLRHSASTLLIRKIHSLYSSFFMVTLVV